MYYREFQVLDRHGRMGAFLERFYQTEGRKRLNQISKLSGFKLSDDMMRDLTLGVAFFTLKNDIEFLRSKAPGVELTRAEDMWKLFHKAPSFVFGYYHRVGTKTVEKVGLATIMRRYFSWQKMDVLDEYLLEEDLKCVPLEQAAKDATKFVKKDFLESKNIEIIDGKYLDDRINGRFKHPREA
jgi:hypothetical protein